MKHIHTDPSNLNNRRPPKGPDPAFRAARARLGKQLYQGEITHDAYLARLKTLDCLEGKGEKEESK